MYGQNEYGARKYASEKAGGTTDEYYMDLFQLVPEFISEKNEMHELFHTQGYEAGFLRYAVEDTVAQCFLSTATWGLKRWEEVFGVETNLQLTYEQRREILQAKIRGQGTTTKEMIKETAVSFSGGEVDIIEENGKGYFIVRFIGIKGIPRNMQGFIQMLEQIKPAHLGYRFEYRYTVWNEIRNEAWDSMKELSWDELRILKED